MLSTTSYQRGSPSLRHGSPHQASWSCSVGVRAAEQPPSNRIGSRSDRQPTRDKVVGEPADQPVEDHAAAPATSPARTPACSPHANSREPAPEQDAERVVRDADDHAPDEQGDDVRRMTVLRVTGHPASRKIAKSRRWQRAGTCPAGPCPPRSRRHPRCRATRRWRRPRSARSSPARTAVSSASSGSRTRTGRLHRSLVGRGHPGLAEDVGAAERDDGGVAGEDSAWR